jgi:hypothetical protein
MGRLKSLIVGAVGTGILLYTSCSISNKYSNENIWARMRPKIERAYKVDWRRSRKTRFQRKVMVKRWQKECAKEKDAKKCMKKKVLQARKAGLVSAKERRKQRYEKLRTDLKNLDSSGASREQRCRYERREAGKLAYGSRRRTKSSEKYKTFEPGAECKGSTEYKKPLNLLGLIGGGLLALYGVITFALSFRRRDPITGAPQ